MAINAKRLMKNIFLTVLGFCFLTTVVKAQRPLYKWWNAGTTNIIVEGQAWQKGLANQFDRLPQRVKDEVSPALWNLSQNNAGEYIRFKTNAAEIIVRYGVSGALSMPHMPSTGVSGVDLYAKNTDGTWSWAPGKYSFRDTIEYHYNNLAPGNAEEFYLYLPLYNTVKWFSIGVPQKATFDLQPATNRKPIVVYGTSIVQGACASRPGLAWTSILGRKLNRTIINLGFSGNGKLEKSIIDLMTEIDAEVYVLDCIPNLTANYKLSDEEIKRRINDAVKELQSKKSAPIILVEHSGGAAKNYLDTARATEYKNSSQLLADAFAGLKKQGIKNIYLLTGKEIGIDINGTVDGLHPNDIGMMAYANAYENILKKILRTTKK
jgi:lysophospholipase L1-like esterase